MIFDKLSKLGPREKTMVGIGLACVLGVVTDRLVVRTVLDSYREMDAAIVEQERKLDYANRVLRHADEVAAAYREVSERMGGRRPAAEVMDTVREAIDEAAMNTGVQLLSTERREPRGADVIEEYLVESRFEATMNDLLSFLHELRTSAAILRIKQLTLTPHRGDGLVKGSIVISRSVVPAVTVDG